MGGSAPSNDIFGQVANQFPGSSLASLFGGIDQMLYGSPPAAPTPASPAPPAAQTGVPTPQIPVTGGANPGQFALGQGFGMMGNPPPNLGINPQVLSQAGSAATPYGFGTPNPYASFFGPGGGAGSPSPGAGNANLMAQIMAGTPTQPTPPASVPVPPVNIPSISYS
jgi:hypothetical protein